MSSFCGVLGITGNYHGREIYSAEESKSATGAVWGVYLRVESEAMVYPGRQDKQVPGCHLNPDPAIVFVPHIKET